MNERVTRVREILGLRRLPIKIGFLDKLPALPRWVGGPVAAGCVFWDAAMDGKSFYTIAADHWNCAIGSHVHKIGLPADRGNELETTLDFMIETRYLDAAEAAEIPTLEREPMAVAYAPASNDAFEADVILLAATPGSLVLIEDAARRAGIGGAGLEAVDRPSCSALPSAVKSQTLALAFGCKSNRTFTKIGADEAYAVIPARKWDAFVDKLLEVQRATLMMGTYFQAHAAKFAGK
ncbi:MAG TPA: DUF169 domain-containing protein [Polyangia bacterium]|jgi:uncharacterized protein (DUF169 family)|nr:DUF169 domain-containing protein [Polyangia bacterium]